MIAEDDRMDREIVVDVTDEEDVTLNLPPSQPASQLNKNLYGRQTESTSIERPPQRETTIKSEPFLHANAPANWRNDSHPQNWIYAVSNEQVVIPYTVGVETAATAIGDGEMTGSWDLTQGFPYPCPVVRDPSRDGEMYIPGKILQQSLSNSQNTTPEQTPARTIEDSLSEDLDQPTSELHVAKTQRTTENEKLITLKDVFEQVPLRLSQYHDDGNRSVGSPKELLVVESCDSTLKQRFARMDRTSRSKFIGLKNSSLRVRDKVLEKRKTNYKEVAEELVNEIGLGEPGDRANTGEAENLKRRVYDVLNVFEAVGLIAKNHKNVYWRGCTAPRPKRIQNLEDQIQVLQGRLERRRLYLQQLVENYNAMVALAERNRNSIGTQTADQKLFLPFFLVHAPEYVPIGVTITQDSRSVQLDFKNCEFQVCGDMWVLRQIGLHRNQTPLTLKLASNDFPGSQEDVSVPETEHCPGLSVLLQNSQGDFVGQSCSPFLPLKAANALGEPEHTPTSSDDLDYTFDQIGISKSVFNTSMNTQQCF